MLKYDHNFSVNNQNRDAQTSERGGLLCYRPLFGEEYEEDGDAA
jgi:hypothetical protein